MTREFAFTDGKKLRIGTMFCIGQNYAKHAKEMGSSVPKDPVVFLKPPAAYVQDGGTVKLPDFSENVHHEVELVVVIGKDCANIQKETVKEAKKKNAQLIISHHGLTHSPIKYFNDTVLDRITLLGNYNISLQFFSNIL